MYKIKIINHLFGVQTSMPIFAPRLIYNSGSIAQLVQSICLTSRGSQVRILLLPQERQKSHSNLSGFLHLANNCKLACKIRELNVKTTRRVGFFVLHLWVTGSQRSCNPVAPTKATNLVAFIFTTRSINICVLISIKSICSLGSVYNVFNK